MPNNAEANKFIENGDKGSWRDIFFAQLKEQFISQSQAGGGERHEGESSFAWDAYHLAHSVAGKPLEWIVPNMIPRGEVTLLAGDAKIGKSLFTLDLAQRLATGKPFGLRPFTDGELSEKDTSDTSDTSDTFNSLSRIGTLLLNLEDGERLLGNRFQQMIGNNRPIPVNLIQVVKAIEFRDLVQHMRSGFIANCRRGEYRNGVNTGAFASETTEGQITLRMQVASLLLKWHLEAFRARKIDCGLVVLDPAVEMLGVTDENSASQVAASIAPLRQFAQSQNVAILLVHHNSKAHSVRGSTAFQASVNTILRLNHNSLRIVSKSFPPTPPTLYVSRNSQTLRYEFRRSGSQQSASNNPGSNGSDSTETDEDQTLQPASASFRLGISEQISEVARLPEKSDISKRATGIVASRQNKLIVESRKFLINHNQVVSFKDLSIYLRDKGLSQGSSEKSLRRLFSTPFANSHFRVERSKIMLRSSDGSQ